MSVLPAFILAEGLLFANVVIWHMSGHPWWASALWFAAMVTFYQLHKWILE